MEYLRGNQTVRKYNQLITLQNCSTAVLQYCTALRFLKVNVILPRPRGNQTVRQGNQLISIQQYNRIAIDLIFFGLNRIAIFDIFFWH